MFEANGESEPNGSVHNTPPTPRCDQAYMSLVVEGREHIKTCFATVKIYLMSSRYDCLSAQAQKEKVREAHWSHRGGNARYAVF